MGDSRRRGEQGQIGKVLGEAGGERDNHTSDSK